MASSSCLNDGYIKADIGFSGKTAIGVLLDTSQEFKIIMPQITNSITVSGSEPSFMLASPSLSTNRVHVFDESKVTFININYLYMFFLIIAVYVFLTVFMLSGGHIGPVGLHFAK